MSTNDFRKRFTERFRLKDGADCERLLLWKTRYPVARVVAPVIEALWPSLFNQDRELVAKVAGQGSIEGVRSLVDFFKAQQSYESSFLRGALRLRVSGRRIMAVANEVFSDTPGAHPHHTSHHAPQPVHQPVAHAAHQPVSQPVQEPVAPPVQEPVSQAAVPSDKAQEQPQPPPVVTPAPKEQAVEVQATATPNQGVPKRGKRRGGKRK